jgi:hypothetical protein
MQGWRGCEEIAFSHMYQGCYGGFTFYSSQAAHGVYSLAGFDGWVANGQGVRPAVS